MIFSDNGRISKISQHVVIIFGYPAIRVELLLTDAWCKTLTTGDNLRMLDMISDSILSLECTTYVMLVEDKLDVIVLERGSISAIGVIVSNLDCIMMKIIAGDSFVQECEVRLGRVSW